MIVVAQKGIRDYSSIQDAINAAQAHDCIYIKNGVYKEKIMVEKNDLTIHGEDKKLTIITYDDYAYKQLSTVTAKGTTMGTFRSFSAFFGGDRLCISNLTIENSSGSGEKIGQAIAAYVDGDDVRFKNCRFLGNQDTLFTGPLPPSPKTAGSFVGPRENAPYKRSRQYYEDCYIEGDVDFIFGSAIASFFKCEIHSKDREPTIKGYITAASTPKEESYGYTFLQCNLTSETEVPSVFLGRPWRPYAKVRFILCDMGPHVFPEGWDPWEDENNKITAEFCEYYSSGPGGNLDRRVSWARSDFFAQT